jgi:DNA topoisomerase-1
MKLVIVESPTKAKTIQKFLGGEFKIKSSFGHVRDLPKAKLGINIENGFEPEYIIPTKARKTVSELKKESEKADETILATDEDREGESIAWHLSEALKLENPERIVFHEITKPAIEKALESPRKIDMNLVSAQQARRVLDRIVGYKLSPFLWKKVARGLSAGRVQSVAVRLIVEKEEEIKKFIAQEYWSIKALFKSKDIEFESILIKDGDKNIEKLDIKDKDQADKILTELSGAKYTANSIDKKETKKYPAPPFTTSTLQQAAWQKFHFSAKATMSIAQKLYEEGYITYHRTDSLNLSDFSLSASREFISKSIGNNYCPPKPIKYKTKSKTAQEAHEAIRPAYPDKTPQSLKELDARQLKLYTLIWQRFIACQMVSAVFDSVSVDIKASSLRKKEYIFRSTGQTLKFDGFLKIYPTKFEEKELPDLSENEILDLISLDSLQHFTEPPARYSEASLIKALEKYGVGRPSTYAPTLTTIQNRNYVQKNEQKRFVPTEMGIIVNDVLIKNFPEVVDIDFTAKMEKELDEVAEGRDTWQKTCEDFYIPFSKNLEEKYEEVEKTDLTKKTDKKCPKCGSELIERLGRFGRFYACSKFPECKYTESMGDKKEKLDIKCPKCKEGDIVQKRTKKGKIFYGCNNFPKCDFALWDKPIDEFCPKCDSILIEKNKKQIKCSNKECDFTKGKNER